jgi:LAO/AO transport system kinase
MNLVEQNFSVAILSIDPSSAVTGGSILGDKTRMQKLSQHPLAYIRPSPSDQKLGGVARKTREVISLCHYFGFDYIFVESVGVGQSEADLAIIADIFTLLVHPGGGDDLQGMKRGILELVDFVIVNKADGDLLKLAQTTAHHYRQSLHILKGEDVPVVTCSSTQGSGIAEVAKSLDQLFAQLTQKGILKKRFDHRRLVWFEDQLKDEIWWKINHDAKLVKKLEKAKEEIAKSKKSISSGIDDFLKEIF